MPRIPRTPRTPRERAECRTWVCLLRGVNVGGRNMVPMGAFRELLEDLGCTGARTYVNSGNAVFRAPGTEESLADRIEKGIAGWFEVSAKAVVRSGEDMRRVAARCPFPKANPAALITVFCAAKPKGKPDPARSPRDEFTLRGRELFVHYRDGIARSKMTLGYIEKCTGTTGTGRNWTTVTTLAGWAAEAGTQPLPGGR